MTKIVIEFELSDCGALHGAPADPQELSDFIANIVAESDLTDMLRITIGNVESGNVFVTSNNV